jgi:hypothetical protein
VRGRLDPTEQQAVLAGFILSFRGKDCQSILLIARVCLIWNWLARAADSLFSSQGDENPASPGRDC